MYIGAKVIGRARDPPRCGEADALLAADHGRTAAGLPAGATWGQVDRLHWLPSHMHISLHCLPSVCRHQPASGPAATWNSRLHGLKSCYTEGSWT